MHWITLVVRAGGVEGFRKRLLSLFTGEREKIGSYSYTTYCKNTESNTQAFYLCVMNLLDLLLIWTIGYISRILLLNGIFVNYLLTFVLTLFTLIWGRPIPRLFPFEIEEPVRGRGGMYEDSIS